MARKDDEKYLKTIWKKNESRLRVAEIIGTDSPEWEMLCRCILDGDSQPDEVFRHLVVTIRNESTSCPVFGEQEGEFFLQGCFDVDGGFEFDKV